MKILIFIYVISTFAVIQVTISNATNVALHKPTDQSSLYLTFGSDRAVDGNRSNVADINKNSCIHTSDNSTIKHAWWRVNLESIYSINTIAITSRHWIEGNRSSAERLAGYSIYISNTTNWWNGVLCYHDNTTTLPDTRDTFYVFCHQSVFGQYVTIYNGRNSTQQHPPSYSKAAILELCEVEIQIPSPCSNCFKLPYPYCQKETNVFRCLNGCKHGLYGEDCGNKCTCGDNGACYQNGTCITCSLGYYPSRTQCTACHPSCGGNGACDVSGGCLSCDPGTYKSGAICATCPSNCGGDNEECDSSDGTCIHGCKYGFHGGICTDKCMSNCDICYNANTCDKCSRGYFGTNCKSRCDGCVDASCNSEGHCTIDCFDGRYGELCNLNCSHNCLHNSCDRNTAICTNGCIDTTYGAHCNKACPIGCGGDKKSCTRLSGLCKSCINGKYGDQCTSNCSTSCGGNRECAFKTGHCVFCVAYMTGPFCNKQIPPESGAAIAALAGALSAAVIVIVILITVMILSKRRNLDKRNDIYSSAVTETNGRDDHVYLSVGYNSGINTHSSATTSSSEGHNDSNTKTPPHRDEDNKLATLGVPSDKTDYYNIDL